MLNQVRATQNAMRVAETSRRLSEEFYSIGYLHASCGAVRDPSEGKDWLAGWDAYHADEAFRHAYPES